MCVLPCCVTLTQGSRAINPAIQDESTFALKPRQQPGHSKQQGAAGAAAADELEVPAGVLGSLLGGAESSRPQRAKRLPAKVLGVTMSAAEEWNYHHQHTANQQQQWQGEEGSQQQQQQGEGEGNRQQQQRTAGKPSNGRPHRAPAKGGRNGGTKARQRAKPSPAECSQGGNCDAGGPQMAAEGEDAPSLQCLPENFQESGMWDDEGLVAQQEEEEEAAAAGGVTRLTPQRTTAMKSLVRQTTAVMMMMSLIFDTM